MVDWMAPPRVQSGITLAMTRPSAGTRPADPRMVVPTRSSTPPLSLVGLSVMWTLPKLQYAKNSAGERSESRIHGLAFQREHAKNALMHPAQRFSTHEALQAFNAECK